MADEVKPDVTGAQPTSDAPPADPKAGAGQPDVDVTGQPIKADPAKPDAAKPTEPPPPEQDVEFALPEGVQVGEKVLGSMKEFAKGLKLDKAGAAKLLEVGLALRSDLEEQIQANWTDTKKAWLEEVRKDKDLGGAHFDATVKSATEVAKRFGGQEFVNFLAKTQMGSNPLVIRFLSKIASSVKEDRISGATDGKAPTSDEAMLKSMYDKSPGLFQG